MNLGDVRAHVWSLVSQVVSSARSIGFAIVAARLLDADDFGLIAIVIGAAIAINGLLRASSSHPLALIDEPPRGDVLTAAIRHQFVLGAVVAVLFVLIAAIAGAPAPLVVGAAVFPAVGLHDAVRIGAINAGRGALAAAADIAWSVLLAGSMLVVTAADAVEPIDLLAAWAGSAGVSAAAVLVVHRRRDRRPVTAVAEHRAAYEPLGRRLAGQLVLELIPTRVLPLAVTAVIAVQDAGALRGAESLLGGATIVWSAMSLSVLRQARHRAREHGAASGFRLVSAVMVIPALVTICNAVVVIVLPDRIGEALLGDTWQGAVDLMPAAAALIVAQVVLGTVATSQRAAHRDDEVRDMLAVAAAISLIAVPSSAAIGGVESALYVDAVCITAAAVFGAVRSFGGNGSGSDHDHQEHPQGVG